MIDAKIIGMSEMKKYRGAEVFRNIIVKLVAGIQSNRSCRKNERGKIHFMKMPNDKIFTLKRLHKKYGWMG